MTEALAVLHELVLAGFGLMPLPEHGLRVTRPAETVLAPALLDRIDRHRATLRWWVDPKTLRNRLQLPATLPIDPQLAVILAWLKEFRDAYGAELHDEFRDEYAVVSAWALAADENSPLWFLALETIERVAVRHLSTTSPQTGRAA
jgi:hypothetical protein